MNTDEFKKTAALDAVQFVEDGMIIGLGTGSTAAHFVDALGEKVRLGLNVQCLVTSEDTRKRALASGIELIEPDESTIVDLAVDGTDEIDAEFNLIKGGGAALLREKIVAYAARRFVVIADVSKRVTTLGAFALPVEIESTYWSLTVSAMRARLADLGYGGRDISLRGTRTTGLVPGAAVLTDGGNYIVDCELGRIDNAAQLHASLLALPGVIETGLFIGIADEAILCGPEGIEHLKRQE